MPDKKNLLQQGFTLIEIMVVVVIIGILGAIVVPEVIHLPDQAKLTAAKTDAENIAQNLELYKLSNGKYPDSLSELSPGKSDNDPWGQAFSYKQCNEDQLAVVYTHAPKSSKIISNVNAAQLSTCGIS